MIYNDFCGEKISRLGFGCMRFPKTYEETKECIDLAMKSGINYYDSAYAYNNSEATLSKCLADYPRSSYHVTSKLPLDFIKEEEDVLRLFNESCSRLQTDYIDFYLLHAMTENRIAMLKKYNVIEKLDKLKKEGRIKHFGFSIHASAKVLKDILSLYDFDFVQIQLNYLDMIHEPGFEGYEILTSRNIPVVIMEPVKGGLLANIPSPLNEPFIEYDKEASCASYCFKFLMQYPNIRVILSGMSSLEQVKDNLHTFEKAPVLDDKLFEAIDNVKNSIEHITKVGCTGCSYCMPCPMGVNIPGNFRVLNMHALGETLNNDWYKNYQYPKDGANLCVQCGKCVSKCPQKIDIPNMLKLTLEN